MDFDFTGRTVLVVGGSSGIGNGIARAFLERGADVHVWGTKAAPADYASDDGSDLTGLHYAQVDVSRNDEINAISPAFAKLDVLVLCQGTVIYSRGEFEMPGFERVVDVNLNSMMACSLKFHEMLRASRGSLIFISSTAAFRTTLGNPAYNASKAAILGLTRALAQAWIKDGVRVNGVAPGLVDTKLTKVTTGNPGRLAASLKLIPSGRLGTPADIAGAVLFLSSSLSDYIVGQTLAVDGGGSL